MVNGVNKGPNVVGQLVNGSLRYTCVVGRSPYASARMLSEQRTNMN